MLAIPMKSDDGEDDLLVIIINATELNRLSDGEPGMMAMKKLEHRLTDPKVFICYEPNTAALNRAIATHDQGEILRYLMRNAAVRPELGDGGPSGYRVADFN